MLEFAISLVIVIAVAYFVSIPLRRAPGLDEGDPHEAELADLEARKQARYREIRDAESDHAAGKLTEADFQRLDRELRQEAVRILKRIDRLRGTAPARDEPSP